jgi:hypothetical protein
MIVNIKLKGASPHISNVVKFLEKSEESHKHLQRSLFLHHHPPPPATHTGLSSVWDFSTFMFQENKKCCALHLRLSQQYVPRVKRPGREAGYSPPTIAQPTSAEVKNTWIYTSPSPYAFVAYCLITCSWAQGQLYLYLLKRWLWRVRLHLQGRSKKPPEEAAYSINMKAEGLFVITEVWNGIVQWAIFRSQTCPHSTVINCFLFTCSQ